MRDVSAVAGLSHEAKRTLLSIGVGTVAGLAELGAGVGRIDGAGWSLSRRADQLVSRAQALRDDSVQPGTEPHSFLMPPRADAAIYLVADNDPVDDTLVTLGYRYVDSSGEHLGWRFHRVWSTDWFYNRKAEIERLRIALSNARAAAEQGIRIDGANCARKPAPTEIATKPDAFEIPEVVEGQMPPYQRAVFPIKTIHEPHEVPISTLADLAQKIVAAEGPLPDAPHIDRGIWRSARQNPWPQASVP